MGAHPRPASGRTPARVRRSAWLLTLLCCLVAPATASAEAPDEAPQARALLRLIEAGHRASYQGVQRIEMYPQGRRVDATARVSHLHRATRTEIETPPRLRGMVIIERGRERLVRRPGKDQWHASPGADVPHYRHLLARYQVAVLGTAQIAGQDTWVVEIRSRATNLPARKLWVDRQTGVVLRAEHYNWSGRLVYATEFETVDYQARPSPADFQVDDAQVVGEAPKPVPPDAGPVPLPSYVPPGFRQVGRPLQMQTQRGPVLHLRYTDGLNAISVFVRKLARGETPRARPALTPMDQPFSAVVHHVKGDLRITLIGDLDPAELRRMAASFE